MSKDSGISAMTSALDGSRTPRGPIEDWRDGLRCVIEASRELVQGREANLA